MTRWVAAGLSAALLLATASAAVADPVAGKRKAAQCQVCHGFDGMGTNPEVPNIGGESEIYLIKQLRAFRDGTREDRMMSLVAKNLSDGDIRDLADYYGAIEITATVPQF
ncbi:c-type cytochrome [Acuticoccus mangrovi]|uniref:Cytochrome c n=1 Tax=Acuticoccus mangrovi TaxID=2796142 RepID=A0A934MMU0_9HYPH|nr:cytochrome c [Acuticoccus mangrovi]MBJ3777584.1 cytochrome c [Acuticoccus mangrovi]